MLYKVRRLRSLSLSKIELVKSRSAQDYKRKKNKALWLNEGHVYAVVMEWEDVRDLKSLGFEPCGFESHQPHHVI